MELEKRLIRARHGFMIRQPRFNQTFAEFILQKIRDKLPIYEKTIVSAVEDGWRALTLNIWSVPSGWNWRWWVGLTDWPQFCRDEPNAMKWLFQAWESFCKTHTNRVAELLGYGKIKLCSKTTGMRYGYVDNVQLVSCKIELDLTPDSTVRMSVLMEPFDQIVPYLRAKYQLSGPTRQLIADMLLEMIRKSFEGHSSSIPTHNSYINSN